MIFNFQLRCNNRDVTLRMDIDETSTSDVALMSYLRNGGPPEPEVVETMARVLQDGDLAIDAGANNGFFSLVMSQFVGSHGRVLAFEPGAVNLKRLYRNLDLNDANNVDVIEQPLWSKPETIDFYLFDDDGANTHYGNGVPVRIKATTLAEQLGGAVPAFIKMDIEGSEFEALLGGPHIIAKHKPIVIEMNEEMLDKAGNGPDSVHNYMRASGFNRFIIHADAALPTLVPWTVKLRSRFANTNILYATLEDVARMWPEVCL